ncbi:hypothetical protein ACFWAR_13595 [Streptomyces sp. NPDC059917]|uniref:hypothetical protein n=1 Tax=Streptomyces sp. NPDC059917 TaxID=3347002 RepID=UPI003665D7F4
MYINHQNQVRLEYTGKQSAKKAQNKAKQVEKDAQAYLRSAGPFASASGFCSQYGYRQGGGREGLARQLFEWAQQKQKQKTSAHQQAVAKQEQGKQQYEQQVRDRAEAWFYGTELGSAYISQVFRLCNRDDLSGAGLQPPTAKEVAAELRETLADCDREADIRLMEPVFSEFLRMTPRQLVDRFRRAFRLPGTPARSKPYYRAEVLSGRFTHQQGDLLRTQSPTSVSTSEAKAAAFFDHREGHGSERVLYTFDGVPTRSLSTALNVSSSGEAEAIVPDRTDLRVLSVRREQHQGRTLVRVTLGPAEEGRQGGWEWMGHDAGLRRVTSH